MAGALFALALLLRLATIGLTGAGSVEFGDAEDYILHASAICEEGIYPERGNNWFFRAPGFPALIAVVTACHPEAVAAIKVALAVLDAATALLIGVLAWLLWRDRAAALAAAGWAAVHPVFLLQITDVRSEGLFMFLLTLALVLFALGLRDGGGRLELLAGLAAGLAALTRPVAIPVVGLLAVARWACGARTPRRRWVGAVLLLLGAAMSLAPWTARNVARYGEVILVNDAFGINFWRGTSPEMIEVMRARDPTAVTRARERFDATIHATAEAVESLADTPATRSRAWLERGLDNIREDPGRYLAFTASKALAYWRPWLDPQFHGTAKVVLSALAIVPVFALGLLGLVKLHRKSPWAVRAVLAFLVLGWLAHVPFQTVMRFRIPFTDPVLLALAAAPLARLASAILRRIGRLPGPPATLPRGRR